jgi:YfiH family protein
VSGSDWRIEDVGGVVIARCRALASVPHLLHAFSTRQAFGGSDFDLGPAEGTDPAVAWRRRAFLVASGLGHGVPRILRQVHGRAVVDAAEPAAALPEADASFLARGSHPRGPFPAVRTADCVPVLIADSRGNACAAVHAGWRGTAACIAEAVINALRSEGCNPREAVIALGPAIGACCYDVGSEVVEAFRAACPDESWLAGRPGGKPRVDLHAALRSQLTRAGVPGSSIHGAPWCTRCRNDLFFSVRGEGQSTGRLMAVIGPGAAP